MPMRRARWRKSRPGAPSSWRGDGWDGAVSVPAPSELVSYRGYRYPAEIISHAVWLYFRFHLNFRDGQELLAERGIIVSHEAIRQWWTKFGPTYAAGLRRRRAGTSDKWHLDEVQLNIKGRHHWLWGQSTSTASSSTSWFSSGAINSAETFLRRVVASAGSEPRVVITDKLASYPPALRRVLPNTEHRRHKGLTNRAENSHQPTRQRERAMRRFKSPEQAQRFLGPFGAVGDHFRVGRYRNPAAARRQLLAEQRRTWRDVVGLPAAA
jgi:putative transposase